MDASIIHLSWSAAAICTIALVAISAAVAGSFIHSLRERRLVREGANELRQAQNAELAITLQQTLADLSILDREVKWHSVRVARIAQESADVRSYYLVDVQSDTLPPFLPGQHLLLERPGGRFSPAAFRCYSLSDDCDEGYWRITVKKSNDHPTSVSRWLHEEVTEGDVLRVRGPAGAFYLRSCTARNAVFLSAGVGVTPLIPMLLQASRRPHGSIHFLAQYREPEHAPLGEWLLAFAKKNPSARIQLWFSNLPERLHSPTSHVVRHGKFTGADVCNDIEEPHESDFYLCGPELWIQTIRQDLLEMGIDEEVIQYELFHTQENGRPNSDQNNSSAEQARDATGSASENQSAFSPSDSVSGPPSDGNPSDGSPGKPTDISPGKSTGRLDPPQAPRGVATQICFVHFRQSKRTGEFTSSVPNLLSLASRNEVPISSGCRTGACGSCAVRLLQGKVRYLRKPQYSLKPTEILPCVCVPDGDIVVDA